MARWIAAGFGRGRSAPDHRYDAIGLNPQNMQMGRQGWPAGIAGGRTGGDRRLPPERRETVQSIGECAEAIRTMALRDKI